MQMINGVPRRNNVAFHTAAEATIRSAMLEVERAGASDLLTQAITLLEQAKNKVADHVEAVIEENVMAAAAAAQNSPAAGQ